MGPPLSVTSAATGFSALKMLRLETQESVQSGHRLTMKHSFSKFSHQPPLNVLPCCCIYSVFCYQSVWLLSFASHCSDEFWKEPARYPAYGSWKLSTSWSSRCLTYAKWFFLTRPCAKERRLDTAWTVCSLGTNAREKTVVTLGNDEVGSQQQNSLLH